MNFFKKLFGHFLFVWTAIVFTITIFIFSIVTFFIRLLPYPKHMHIFIKASKIWISTFLFCIGCRLKVKGKENFKKDENYIVICNHNSFMDVPITCPYVPGGNKTISKIELSKIPIFGLVYKTGSVLVDRKNKNSRVDSYLKMKQTLNSGLHMCIYPEGTRNKTNEPLAPFHDGAFKLAFDTNKSIIPGVLFNTKKALPLSQNYVAFPATMYMHFLPAIPPQQFNSVEELKNYCFETMKN
jgi:1-acyl-sn-glycerol-3-phosphate acyltransferase